jgi:hypothetical protein
MAAREEIIITFDQDSPEVKVEAAGVIGPRCKALTQPFEEGLGLLQGQRTLKPEFHQQPAQSGLKIGGGKP